MDSVIWEAGFWSEDTMRRALTQGYQTLLIERRKKYGDALVGTVRDGIPFGDVVAKHFALTATAGRRPDLRSLQRRDDFDAYPAWPARPRNGPVGCAFSSPVAS